MLSRKELIEKIINLLSLLQNNVKLGNTINLTDTNIHSENFYRDLLNLIFDYELNNINTAQQNSVAIDLYDEKNKIAFQITATGSLVKTRETVTGFIKNELYKKYDKLIILNIVQKKKHKDKFVGDDKIFQINTKEDIWDISTLLNHINNFQLEKLKEIYQFLHKEISIGNEYKISKEIRTFISLIQLLSDESQPSVGKGFIENPDPDFKIKERFQGHEQFLKNIYTELYAEYGQILDEVIQDPEIGTVKMRRLGTHLKIISDNTLKKCNGDPKKALEDLIAHFKEELSRSSMSFDEGAIRFFLVHELITCNVFPNKECDYE
ncbi:SMEK domain-containing protein [Legionella qingyii]|uniref:SMEK domain-containing protein n=1 Tax=Legionella qingyii TaxID=2184757 RepID=UPI000F8E1263|nr:SMEK domain-containing protein [Legionella qingyii]RUR24265.1 hypothetical protein ELY16_11840 [Legionella qingyii]